MERGDLRDAASAAEAASPRRIGVLVRPTPSKRNVYANAGAPKRISDRGEDRPDEDFIQMKSKLPLTQ